MTETEPFSTMLEHAVAAIGELVMTQIEAEPRRPTRRFMTCQAQEVARLVETDLRAAKALADGCGLTALVAAARDDCLVGVPPDDALLLLQARWDAVAVEVSRLIDWRAHARENHVRCPRCHGVMDERISGPTKRGLAPGREFRRLANSNRYRTRMCADCGLMRRP